MSSVEYGHKNIIVIDESIAFQHLKRKVSTHETTFKYSIQSIINLSYLVGFGQRRSIHFVIKFFSAIKFVHVPIVWNLIVHY